MVPLVYMLGASVCLGGRMSDTDRLKRCPRCPPETALQPIENFARSRHSHDGRQTYCRPCQQARVAAAYSKLTPEERRECKRRAMQRWRAKRRQSKEGWRPWLRLGASLCW